MKTASKILFILAIISNAIGCIVMVYVSFVIYQKPYLGVTMLEWLILGGMALGNVLRFKVFAKEPIAAGISTIICFLFNPFAIASGVLLFIYGYQKLSKVEASKPKETLKLEPNASFDKEKKYCMEDYIKALRRLNGYTYGSSYLAKRYKTIELWKEIERYRNRLLIELASLDSDYKNGKIDFDKYSQKKNFMEFEIREANHVLPKEYKKEYHSKQNEYADAFR